VNPSRSDVLRIPVRSSRRRECKTPTRVASSDRTEGLEDQKGEVLAKTHFSGAYTNLSARRGRANATAHCARVGRDFSRPVDCRDENKQKRTAGSCRSIGYRAAQLILRWSFPRMTPPSQAKTFVDLVEARVEERSDALAYRFLATGDVTGSTAVLTYRALGTRTRAGSSAPSAQATGERALLLYPPGLDFVTAFLMSVQRDHRRARSAAPPGPRREDAPTSRRHRRRLWSALRLTTEQILRKCRPPRGSGRADLPGVGRHRFGAVRGLGRQRAACAHG
jgi:hypothetical protein